LRISVALSRGSGESQPPGAPVAQPGCYTPRPTWDRRQHVRREEFTKLKNEWKKITAPLEKANEKPLRFLRSFLMANHTIRNERADAVVRDDGIYDWFIDRANTALCGYADRPFEFMRRITRSVEHYLDFTEGYVDGRPLAPTLPRSMGRLTQQLRGWGARGQGWIERNTAYQSVAICR